MVSNSFKSLFGTCVKSAVYTMCDVFFISCKHSSGGESETVTTSLLGFNCSDSHLGPLRQCSQAPSSENVMLRVGMSAGLSTPGQCLHDDDGMRLRTSLTLN